MYDYCDCCFCHPARRSNPPKTLNLPSLKEQQRIVNALSNSHQEAQMLVDKAQRMLRLAKQLRYAYLGKYFSRKDLRHNPQVAFSTAISLKGGDPDADFWISRSGQPHNVGRPFRRNDPDYIEMENDFEWNERERLPRGKRRIQLARISRAGFDPRNHIGVTVIRPDLLLPEFLYYVAEYAWQAKVFQNLCTGTLALQHIRQRDVKCAIATVLA